MGAYGTNLEGTPGWPWMRRAEGLVSKLYKTMTLFCWNCKRLMVEGGYGNVTFNRYAYLLDRL